MAAITNPRVFRFLMYAMAVLITAGSIWYSNRLVSRLGEEEEKKVKLYAEALNFIGDVESHGSEGCESLEPEFVFDKIIKKVDLVPTVLVDEEGNISSQQNLDIPPGLSKADSIAELQRQFLAVKNAHLHEPIEIRFFGKKNFVWYDESKLLKQLRVFPYLQLLVIVLFITIVFISFSVAKKNEQNKVWVGLAKETAHQLGTPVSSLLAWVELLRLKMAEKPEDAELVTELEKDVRRLETITERFSKIGSEPEMHPTEMSALLETSADYIRKRMPRRVALSIRNQLSAGSMLPVNSPLFSWVIENLLKNALDAIQGEGTISIAATENEKEFMVDVSDTGKGIPRKDWENVFKPGFTTKKRGWGLGLSLSRRIITDYHGGKIFVQHSEPGKGTTFRIMLPKRKLS